MAHFAEIDENNIVTQVLVVGDDQEHRGHEFLSVDLGLGGTWKRCSYNTHGGVHYNAETNQPSEDQSKAYRKNYPGIGFTFDEERDAFIPPQPFPSWILDEFSCQWNPPIPYPETDVESDGTPIFYYWDEENLQWAEQELNP